MPSSRCSSSGATNDDRRLWKTVSGVARRPRGRCRCAPDWNKAFTLQKNSRHVHCIPCWTACRPAGGSSPEFGRRRHEVAFSRAASSVRNQDWLHPSESHILAGRSEACRCRSSCPRCSRSITHLPGQRFTLGPAKAARCSRSRNSGISARQFHRQEQRQSLPAQASGRISVVNWTNRFMPDDDGYSESSRS